MLKRMVSACAFAVLAAAMSGTASAQGPADYRTFFTFDQPVALPGVTLPPGKYLFRVSDVSDSRRVVQVLSEDATRAYATLMAIPAQRYEPAAEPELRFMETAQNMPAAVKTWWYPGRSIGWEFIYPKAQALRLAKGATDPVLTTVQTGDATPDEMKTAELSRVSSTGEQTSVAAEERPAATTPAGETAQGEIVASTLMIPAVPGPVPMTSADANASNGQTTGTEASGASTTGARAPRTSLPRTASAQPAILMVGAISLGAGVTLRRWSRMRTSRSA